jgi:hypothetical protein
LRTGKKSAALLTLLGDAAKGWLAVLLARRHSGCVQYRWRSRLRWSGSKKSLQHKHLRCPDCAMATPRRGRETQPQWPRASPQGTV